MPYYTKGKERNCSTKHKAIEIAVGRMGSTVLQVTQSFCRAEHWNPHTKSWECWRQPSGTAAA